MSQVRIRQAATSDWERGLADSLRALAPCPEGDYQVWIEDAFCERDRQNIITLVAEVEGRVVGTASLLMERKLIRGCALAGHIEDVAVHPDWQNKGIGKLLVARCLAVAWGNGCYKVILDCDPALSPFYGSLGFHDNGSCMRVDKPYDHANIASIQQASEGANGQE